MRGGPQSFELPCLAPPVWECGENREGKDNNLMAWNSTAADLQAQHKTHPRDWGTAAGAGQEDKLLSTPRPQNTVWDPWGSQPPIVDPCPPKTPSVTILHLNLHWAGCPQLASHIRFNWHSGHKSLRKDCENSVKGQRHAMRCLQLIKLQICHDGQVFIVSVP